MLYPSGRSLRTTCFSLTSHLAGPPRLERKQPLREWIVAMCKIEQVYSGTACATPADIMKRAIEQAAARISDVSPSNRIDGRTSSSRYVGDPRCSSPALTAMPLPQLGWCRILHQPS